MWTAWKALAQSLEMCAASITVKPFAADCIALSFWVQRIEAFLLLILYYL